MFEVRPPASEAAIATRERILDAAERLFAERGFAGTSLRAITGRAGANVAAVHYHFGSKEALLAAVLARRVDPINAERLERLAALERDGKPSLEALLDAFLRPALLRVAGEPELRDVSALLFSEPVAVVGPLVADLFGGLAERFADALGRALPALPRDELVERFHHVVGAMLHAISGRAGLAFRSPSPDYDEVALARMIAFLAAGLRLPPARESGP